jgi:spore coat polysaccharide biosynthesis protein SpsF
VGAVLAFLQARIDSNRLPGKVLLRIQGRSILEHAIRRLRAARTVDEVVVLTTGLEADVQVVDEARRLGTAVFRGPELDVLKRFQLASDRFHPDIVIRATADNPLIDVDSIDRIVRALQSSDLEYCVESGLPYGAVTEAITAKALQRSDEEATEGRHREHVTLYVKEHPELFRLAFLTPPDALRQPELRVTVDTPEDFMFVEELMQAIPDTGRVTPLEHYIRIAPNLFRNRS